MLWYGGVMRSVVSDSRANWALVFVTFAACPKDWPYGGSVAIQFGALYTVLETRRLSSMGMYFIST